MVEIIEIDCQHWTEKMNEVAAKPLTRKEKAEQIYAKMRANISQIQTLEDRNMLATRKGDWKAAGNYKNQAQALRDENDAFTIQLDKLEMGR